MAKPFYFWQTVSKRPNGNPAWKRERGIGGALREGLENRWIEKGREEGKKRGGRERERELKQHLKTGNFCMHSTQAE